MTWSDISHAPCGSSRMAEKDGRGAEQHFASAENGFRIVGPKVLSALLLGRTQGSSIVRRLRRMQPL